MKRFILLFSTVFWFQVGFGSEIDSFSRRHEYLPDSKNIINLKVNFYLQEAINLANRKNDCKEKTLYRSIRKYFKNHYVDVFSDWLYHSEDVYRRTIYLKDSIYQDLNAIDSIILGGTGKLTEVAGSIININGHLIGTDKLEHLFGRGLVYYKRYYLKKQPIEKVMRFGAKTEKLWLGALTTGIYSYADLAANFSGLLFWNHLLKKYDDILPSKQYLGPYIICKNKQWKLNQFIDISNYIDSSFDEGINCSKFRTKKILTKVLNRIKGLEEKNNVSLTCPIQRKSILNLKQKYGEYAKYFINDEGHQVLNK